MRPKVRIYTTSYCGYCRMAKRFLSEKGVRFEEIDVTTDFQKRDWLVRETGRMTVPQVFIGERPVGGFTDLQTLDAKGVLDGLLAGENSPS